MHKNSPAHCGRAAAGNPPWRVSLVAWLKLSWDGRCVCLLLVVCGCLALPGCVPHDRLAFPAAALTHDADSRGFDTDDNGKVDFVVRRGDGEHADRLDVLAYDDDEDGHADRLYRLSAYDNARVPHLIVLLDSIPFEAMRRAWGRDDRFSFFDRPLKVIAPFPSMSALCFSAMLHAPPMSGTINRHYDSRPQVNGVNNLIAKRLRGYRNPWQRRLHYNLRYTHNSEAFLNPRPWMRIEFERARRAFDDSPDRVTLVYISSTAAMLAQYGKDGLAEIFDELERFVLQVLHERRGAVKISVMADHGHNLRDTDWIDVGRPLRDAGFRVTDKIKGPDDVFIEMDGLLTFFGVHTARPVEAGNALLEGISQIETISQVEGLDVVVRNHLGRARIRESDGRLTYIPESANVLEYDAALHHVALTRDEWFARTVDAHYPDGPPRLWDAFHGGTVNVPQLLVTLDDGYCAGIGWFQWFITMRSTHGGLNQVNSATFLMSMTGRTEGVTLGALRSEEVIQTIEPGFVPAVVSD